MRAVDAILPPPKRLKPTRESRIFAGAADATRFFMGQADVHKALEKVTALLEQAGIPYAVLGALALAEHGYRRMTVDIDLLLTPDGIAEFKRRHLGRGYLEKFPGSKGLRDTENGVPIDVVLSGEYPGDGRPKPVAFPEPGSVALVGDKLRVLPLTKLIELKLASGISAPHRLRDLADVLELIRAATLSRDLAGELHPWVRDKYDELWQAAAQSTSQE